MSDERRINVGLTRARFSMIIIGDARTLQIDERWANLIKHCMKGGCFYTAQKPLQVGRAGSGGAGCTDPRCNGS